MNKIAELKVGQKIELNVSEYELTNDDRKEKHPIFEIVKVTEVNPIIETAKVEFSDGQWSMIDCDSEFYTLPNTRKLERKADVVNHPSHYTYGDIEVIDYIEQVIKDYPPKLGFSIGNAIKYISRATHKNGKEDLDKARWYLQRAFDNWEDKR